MKPVGAARRIAALIVATLVWSAAGSDAKSAGADIGHFANQTSKDVVVYLSDHAQHYREIFGLRVGATDIAYVGFHTTVIVTVAPPEKTGQPMLTPKGKRVVKSKLFVPARADGDTSYRHHRYIIRDGAVTFIASSSSKKPQGPVGTRHVVTFGDD